MIARSPRRVHLTLLGTAAAAATLSLGLAGCSRAPSLEVQGERGTPVPLATPQGSVTPTAQDTAEANRLSSDWSGNERAQHEREAYAQGYHSPGIPWWVWWYLFNHPGSSYQTSLRSRSFMPSQGFGAATRTGSSRDGVGSAHGETVRGGFGGLRGGGAGA